MKDRERPSKGAGRRRGRERCEDIERRNSWCFASREVSFCTVLYCTVLCMCGCCYCSPAGEDSDVGVKEWRKEGVVGIRDNDQDEHHLSTTHSLLIEWETEGWRWREKEKGGYRGGMKEGGGRVLASSKRVSEPLSNRCRGGARSAHWLLRTLMSSLSRSSPPKVPTTPAADATAAAADASRASPPPTLSKTVHSSFSLLVSFSPFSTNSIGAATTAATAAAAFPDVCSYWSKRDKATDRERDRERERERME